MHTTATTVYAPAVTAVLIRGILREELPQAHADHLTTRLLEVLTVPEQQPLALYVAEPLNIRLDPRRRKADVAAITETAFFACLRARQLRTLPPDWDWDTLTLHEGGTPLHEDVHAWEMQWTATLAAPPSPEPEPEPPLRFAEAAGAWEGVI